MTLVTSSSGHLLVESCIVQSASQSLDAGVPEQLCLLWRGGAGEIQSAW